MRKERDTIGERSIPVNSLTGIHTLRAQENFFVSGRSVHPSLIHAYGSVKYACYKATRLFPSVANTIPDKLDALERAAIEVSEGRHDSIVKIDALQGGAGTSLNMCINEIIANRALQILGKSPGDPYISPLDDANRFQSTNDTFPTALRLAAIRLIKSLEESVVALQESFQAKEKSFSHIVKVGRTEYQDAVLTTLGREMGSYAEAISRDRWRLYKCEERLRVINLGGTAIGTGMAAPRAYIFGVADKLREITGIGFARAENLVEATQNTDIFVEVSGILKALASSLIKICSDLRLLSSGPDAGIGEITLPPRQSGSSIMPGKINPVIPECVTQAAMKVIGLDTTLTIACSSGSLELNPFMPLVADCLLTEIELLARTCHTLKNNCISGITANENICSLHVENSTVIATALIPALGYEAVSKAISRAKDMKRPVREILVSEGLITHERINDLMKPEAVMRLGSPDNFFKVQ
jgi:aspartate ammonia-lyase